MPDKTRINIDGTDIEQFSNESILLAMDSVGAGFSFTAPFFPGTKTYRDLFRPREYRKAKLYIGNDLRVTGKISKISPALSDTANTVNVQVQSLPGVMIKSTFEKADFPIEFNQAALDEIANNVLSKFNIETSFPDGAGAIFEKAGPRSPTSTIFSFLQPLAAQRVLLMGQTNDGKALFRKPKTTGEPVAELIEGHQGIIISTADYDDTNGFSSYDAFGQESGKNDNYATIANPTVKDIRPKSIQANDTNQGNIEDAARWALSADIAKSINSPIGYEGWLRPDGKLWEENQLVVVHAPSLMIYRPFTFLIKSVTLNNTADKKTTSFSLTLPEAYTGEVPTRMPWEE